MVLLCLLIHLPVHASTETQAAAPPVLAEELAHNSQESVATTPVKLREPDDFEPSTLGLLALGLIALGLARRKARE